MNLNQLIYFETLAQLEHVSRASEKLNIAQPSLSKAIANLEQELGVDLFEKQGRNVVLTRQGKLYLDYVQKALKSLEEGRSALQRMQSELNLRIDIGFVSSLQARMMPQLLADYRQATGSQTRFACYEGTTVTLLEQLEEGTLDLALGSEPRDPVRFGSDPVFRQELVVLTPKTARWQGVSSLSLEQVAVQPLILHTRNTGMRKIVLDLFEEADLKPEVAEEATEESMIASLVAMDLGIAIVSLSPAVQLPTVNILRLDHPKNYRYIHLIYLRHHYLSPAVRHFQNYVLKWAQTPAAA